MSKSTLSLEEINNKIEKNKNTHICYKDEKKYIEVPFNVDEDIEKIEVSVWFDKKDGSCVIDLGLRDSENIRGWSGGARNKIFVSQYSATFGYVKNEIKKGQWAVILGTYKIPKDGCEVNIKITLYKKHYRWLKGDFHTHSYHSDGKYTLENVAQIAEEKGLDFIALTDHNTVSQNYSYDETKDVLFIPGMELTTNFGHCNFLGVDNPIRDFRCLNRKQIEKLIDEAKNNKAKIVLNHPLDENCGWKFGLDVYYDAIEIWNGHPLGIHNMKALNWWQKELEKGKKINIVGGSDIHRDNDFIEHGRPTTWVWSLEKSKSHILDAICKGHSFISYKENGPTIDIRCSKYLMGDIIGLNKKEEIDIKCKSLQDNDLVRIISNKGTIEQYKIKEYTTLHRKVKMEDKKFIRVEVWRWCIEVDDYVIASISNPIYNK
ncbi:CehA/McbA family metallohydrolase [Clostridium oceanicum]|uniref:Polymerase/histidinol phosphatase N-terminal domain-containing protein n=1 Tax=Clostridium oceanicum TaxID=1543 RepID=A0ABN1J8K7_9CLOT